MTANKIDLAEFLNQQHLCESLTIKEVRTLLDYTELVIYHRGEVVADIGEVGEALYFVVAGEAALFYDNAGEELEIGRVSEGELMGEMSFFDREPRSVRMRAVTANTRVLKLTRTMYNRLRVEHPFIAVNLLEHAIISLDRLFRRVSWDVASFASYVQGAGKR